MKKISFNNLSNEERHELVTENLWIAKIIAYKEYNKSHKTISQEDLIQEGNVGLVIASQRYKEKKDASFQTYASIWVRSKIKQALEKEFTTTSKATYQRAKIYQTRTDLENASHNKDECSYQEIADEMKKRHNISLTTGEIMSVLSPQKVYLDDIKEEDSEDLKDIILKNNQTLLEEEKIDKISEEKEEREIIKKEIKNLSKLHRTVMYLRFYSDPTKILTYLEIGKKLNISKQRVQQIEKRAISELRRNPVIFNMIDRPSL